MCEHRYFLCGHKNEKPTPCERAVRRGLSCNKDYVQKAYPKRDCGTCVKRCDKEKKQAEKEEKADRKRAEKQAHEDRVRKGRMKMKEEERRRKEARKQELDRPKNEVKARSRGSHSNSVQAYDSPGLGKGQKPRDNGPESDQLRGSTTGHPSKYTNREDHVMNPNHPMKFEVDDLHYNGFDAGHKRSNSRYTVSVDNAHELQVPMNDRLMSRDRVQSRGRSRTSRRLVHEQQNQPNEYLGDKGSTNSERYWEQATHGVGRRQNQESAVVSSKRTAIDGRSTADGNGGGSRMPHDRINQPYNSRDYAAGAIASNLVPIDEALGPDKVQLEIEVEEDDPTYYSESESERSFSERR